MKEKVYVIHGYGADSESNFFPWLKQKLNSDNIECNVLDLPNTNYPKLNEWIEYINKNVSELNENIYFVGHSLGCISVLKFLSQFNKNSKIGGLILVSGFDEKLPLFPTLNSFVSDKIDYSKIINMTQKITVIASQDDDLVPIEYSWELSKNLKSKFLKLNGYGHFLVPDLPIVYEILKKWFF